MISYKSISYVKYDKVELMAINFLVFSFYFSFAQYHKNFGSWGEQGEENLLIKFFYEL